VPDENQRQDQGLLTARRVRVGAGIIIVVGAIALVALIWYIFLRPEGPPPVGPDAPLIPEGASIGQTLALVGFISI
jgi:hypothetical protein